LPRKWQWNRTSYQSLPLVSLDVGIGHFLNLYTLNSLTCLSLGVLQSPRVLVSPDNCFWISESFAVTYQRLLKFVLCLIKTNLLEQTISHSLLQAFGTG
jgi:hypothetical protein